MTHIFLPFYARKVNKRFLPVLLLFVCTRDTNERIRVVLWFFVGIITDVRKNTYGGKFWRCHSIRKMIFGEILGSTLVAAWGKGETTALIQWGRGTRVKTLQFLLFFVGDGSR